MFARRRLRGRSPAFRRPRWYWTISVRSELWLEPTRCERRDSSRSRAWFMPCSRSVRLAKVFVYISEPRCGKASVSFGFDRWVGLERGDRRGARAEHGNAQLPGETVEQAADGLFAFGRGGEHGMREAGQVGAEPERLGGIEPVLQAAARDQWQPRCGAVGRDQRLGRGDAPLRKGERQLAFLRALTAERLHPGEAGAAETRDIDGRHTGAHQQLRGPPGDAAADLLDDHRDGQLVAEGRDLLDQPPEVVVAFGLERLLQWVEMQQERVRTDHLDRFQALLLAHAVVELDRAQVRGQQDGK